MPPGARRTAAACNRPRSRVLRCATDPVWRCAVLDRDRPMMRENARIAAVLLLVYPREGAPHVVFTQRTNTVSAHRGQISLPGGSRDPNDGSLEVTALRETHEELGIAPAHVDVWGRLDDVYVHTSNFVIAPYVGALGYEPTFCVSPEEVDHVIEVPLDTLRDPRILREDDWILRGAVRRVQFYEYGRYQIWGATARVIELFLASPYLERAAAAPEPWGDGSRAGAVASKEIQHG